MQESRRPHKATVLIRAEVHPLTATGKIAGVCQTRSKVLTIEAGTFEECQVKLDKIFQEIMNAKSKVE